MRNLSLEWGARCAVLAVCCTARYIHAQSPTPSAIARVDTFMSRAAQHGLSGTLLVARHDSILLLRAYGIADRGSRTALTVGSPFFLGSIAKTFTAAAILRLEADKKLSVHDSVRKFFPAVRGPIANVTLDQMLSHTAALPYLPTAGLFGEGTRDSVMREMLAESLEFEPGARYGYSSVGFTLLAGVVERVSGEPYERFVERTLFAPAHLSSAGFVGDSLRWRQPSTRSYSDNEPEPSLAELPAFPRMVGAGSIVMTVSDLYQWYRSLLAGQILPKDAADKLFRPRTQIRAGQSGGYAWTIATIPSGSLRLIAGDIGGFNAEIRHYVDEQFVVAFGSNRRTHGRGDREIVMNNVGRIMRGTDVPLPPALARSSPSQLQRMEGEYTTQDGGHLLVRIHGDSLLLGATDSAGVAALHSPNEAANENPSQLGAAANWLLAALGRPGAGLDTLFDSSLPADVRSNVVRRLRAEFQDSSTAPPELLGSYVNGSDGITYLRTHRRGRPPEFASLMWRGTKLTGVEFNQAVASPELLALEPSGSGVAYDLITGRTIRLAMTGIVTLEVGGVKRRILRVNSR